MRRRCGVEVVRLERLSRPCPMLTVEQSSKVFSRPSYIMHIARHLLHLRIPNFKRSSPIAIIVVAVRCLPQGYDLRALYLAGMAHGLMQ